MAHYISSVHSISVSKVFNVIQLSAPSACTVSPPGAKARLLLDLRCSSVTVQQWSLQCQCRRQCAVLSPFCRRRARDVVLQRQHLQQVSSVSKVKDAASRQNLIRGLTFSFIFFLSASFFFPPSGIRSSSQLSSLFVKHKSRNFRMKTRARTCRGQQRPQLLS